MQRTRRVVIRRAEKSSAELPAWSAEGAVLVQWLIAQGKWREVIGRFRVARSASGYVGIDVFLFFVLFFASRWSESIKRFGEAVARHRRELAALGGRREFATPASISRFCSVVRAEDARSFGTWLLLEACDASELLRHPAAATYDTHGEGWHMFDFDSKVEPIRHRALPQGPTLPQAKRRSDGMGKVGYMGRKRGDVRFSRTDLQHAGTGLWVHASLTDGRGDTAAQMPAVLAAVRATCQYAGLAVERAVIRGDGAGGNVPWLAECQQARIHYLTRSAHYALLDDEDIQQWLARTSWYAVASSGSGPVRYAAELGEVTLFPGTETRDAEDRRPLPVRTRMVVSRFRSDEKSGAGVIRDGWQYELYATDLPPDAWPAPETVQQYYGRVGQENRFGQEDRELDLTRIFSYHLPGQEVVTLIGLFVWNLRVTRGFALANVPAAPPADSPRIAPVARLEAEQAAEAPPALGSPPMETRGQVPPSSDESTPRMESMAPSGTLLVRPVAPPGASETSTTTTIPVVTQLSSAGQGCSLPVTESYQETLDRLDWNGILDSLPAGWGRSADPPGLRCPNGSPLPLSEVRLANGSRRAKIRFLASSSDCRSCPLRDECGDGTRPDFVKEITRATSRIEVAEELARLLPLERKRRRRAAWRPAAKPEAHPSPRPPRPGAGFLPAVACQPGPRTIVDPRLLIGALRETVRRACRDVTVQVIALPPNNTSTRHPALAASCAERQRRRQSWEERVRRNSLPDDADVTITFSDPHGLAGMLEIQSRPDEIDA